MMTSEGGGGGGGGGGEGIIHASHSYTVKTHDVFQKLLNHHCAKMLIFRPNTDEFWFCPLVITRSVFFEVLHAIDIAMRKNAHVST